MGAILFAMGWVGNLEGMGYWTLQEKCLWSYWKNGKGGQEGFTRDWEGEKGKAIIILMWPSSQRMDWMEASHIYGLIWRSCSLLSFVPCCVQHVCNFFPESKLISPWLHAMHAILQLQPYDSIVISSSRAIAWFRWINAFLLANQSSFTCFYIR
jgi:hypothetical protein